MSKTSLDVAGQHECGPTGWLAEAGRSSRQRGSWPKAQPLSTWRQTRRRRASGRGSGTRSSSSRSAAPRRPRRSGARGTAGRWTWPLRPHAPHSGRGRRGLPRSRGLPTCQAAPRRQDACRGGLRAAEHRNDRRVDPADGPTLTRRAVLATDLIHVDTSRVNYGKPSAEKKSASVVVAVEGPAAPPV